MDTGPEEESIGGLLNRLAEDARNFGEAEFAYYRALAAEKLEAARSSLWMGATAAALLLAAAIALVLGAVLALTPWIGAVLATLVVVALTGGGAWLLGRIAWRKIKHLLGLIK